jgi:hypothetical protein
MKPRKTALLQLLIEISVELLLRLYCGGMLLLRHASLHCLIVVIDLWIHNDDGLILFNQVELRNLLLVLSALMDSAFFEGLGINGGGMRSNGTDLLREI